jgi:hypothetical protein
MTGPRLRSIEELLVVFWILRLNPYVECQFSSSLRVERGSGLGQRSPSKAAAAENAISSAFILECTGKKWQGG